MHVNMWVEHHFLHVQATSCVTLTSPALGPRAAPAMATLVRTLPAPAQAQAACCHDLSLELVSQGFVQLCTIEGVVDCSDDGVVVFLP